MTFPKFAAEVLYPISDDREAIREEEEERNNEWLQWALAAGLLGTAAGVGLYYKDDIAEALKGRIADSRSPVDRFTQENLGTSVAGIGAGAGVASSLVPGMRRSRSLMGDMSDYQDAPGLGRRLTQTGDLPEHVQRMQSAVGDWGPQWAGAKSRTGAGDIGRLLTDASAGGGELSPFGFLNRQSGDLFSGFEDGGRVPADATTYLDGAQGRRFFDSSGAGGESTAGWLRGRLSRRGGTEFDSFLNNLTTVGEHATAGRAALDAGTGDFNTRWGALTPQQRASLAMEARVGRGLGAQTADFGDGGVLRSGLNLQGLPARLRTARGIDPGGAFRRTWTRGLTGGAIGLGVGTAANALVGQN